MVHFQTGIITVTVLLIFHVGLTRSQTIPSDSPPLLPPIMEECGSSIFPLAPCGPYVQGQSPETNLQCCQNLAQVYHDQPGCLCLFLNGTALAALPINTTRALLLPKLCDVHIDSSSCLSPGSNSAPPTAPSSQGSFTRSPTTFTAGSPTVTVAPRPSTVRFGMGISSAYKIAGVQFGVLAAVSILLATLLW
ncbi:non-specific lipid transfer protein GPI-anchored 10 [Silene latifolia]|uniref:non-specific lipid transfer protein GPI-anchored 10 n=1 Tax=Silene latifolia TaxID=37657 RepID=UPI003D76B8D4